MSDWLEDYMDETLTTVREANIDPSLGGPYVWVRNDRNTLELFHKRDLLALQASTEASA